MKPRGAPALGWAAWAAVACALGLNVRAAVCAAEAPPHRNLILILTDDQRFDALGALNPFFTTPNLDALAAAGVLFESAFVTTSLCSPSRASILTGLYAHRHRVLDNTTPLDRGLTTFPLLLQQRGYETAFIGKWHMGGAEDSPQPGFERWVSFRGQGVYRDPTFNIDGERLKLTGHTTDLITDSAVEFLRGRHERPFFLYVSHKAVHAPFEPAERHEGLYAERPYPRPDSMTDTDENYKGKPAWVRAQRGSWHGVDGMYNDSTTFDQFVQDYAECLLGIDESVGRIVGTLRELGLLESTLIVFTSDNGFLFGEHGLIDKRTMYEASIRVPLIVHCPELVAGGRRLRPMVLTLDLGPTLLEVAGVAIPESMQGRSFLPLLTEPAAPAWREAFLYEYFWERAFPQTPTVLGVRTDRYKFMQYHGVWDRYELYDLEADPMEMNNLLGDVRILHEGGSLDSLIARTAGEPVRELFLDLNDRLKALLAETGCAPEPTWSLPWPAR